MAAELETDAVDWHTGWSQQNNNFWDSKLK